MSASQPVSPHPLRVFLVEDHADTRKWMAICLEDLGHTVVSAATMAEAIKELPDANCDVLLCDMGLPDGDGWELLPKLRLKKPIFAIAMSGFGMEGDRAKSKAAGYRHHILKPFDPGELEAILEEAAGTLPK